MPFDPKPTKRKCPTCGSLGFAESPLGSDRCAYCDGTEGGHPPTVADCAEKIRDLERHVRSLKIRPIAGEAGVYTARGIGDLGELVANLAEQGFRIVTVIDTQNGDYNVVAQKARW